MFLQLPTLRRRASRSAPAAVSFLSLIHVAVSLSLSLSLNARPVSLNISFAGDSVESTSKENSGAIFHGGSFSLKSGKSRAWSSLPTIRPPRRISHSGMKLDSDCAARCEVFDGVSDNVNVAMVNAAPPSHSQQLF